MNLTCIGTQVCDLGDHNGGLGVSHQSAHVDNCISPITGATY